MFEKRIVEVEKKNYLFNFPDFNKFKEEIEEEGDDTGRKSFWNEWVDVHKESEIMGESTSGSLNEDKDIHIEDLSDIDVYIEAGENVLDQMKNYVKNLLTDEEIFELMPYNLKKKFNKLKKNIEELKVIDKI